MEAVKKIELSKAVKIIFLALVGTLLLTISAKIKISAVATANLLNFINNGLINARKKIIENNFDLPKW